MQDITRLASACEVVGSTLADINEVRYMQHSVQRQVTRVNFRLRKMHSIFIYEAQTTKLWSGIGRLHFIPTPDIPDIRARQDLTSMAGLRWCK